MIDRALFVAIAAGVPSGPVCLLFAFLFWMTVVLSISHCRMSLSSHPLGTRSDADRLQKLRLSQCFRWTDHSFAWQVGWWTQHSVWQLDGITSSVSARSKSSLLLTCGVVLPDFLCHLRSDHHKHSRRILGLRQVACDPDHGIVDLLSLDQCLPSRLVWGS